jgi:hypothetical protein
MTAWMSPHVLPKGRAATDQVRPPSREMLTSGRLQILVQSIFWAMTATTLGSNGSTDSVGSVPEFTRA